VATAMLAGDWHGAQRRVNEVLQQYPAFKLTHLLEAEIHRHLGETERAEEAMAQYRPEKGLGRMAHARSSATIHYVAPSAAASLARLGLADMALQLLREVRTGPSAEAIFQVVNEYMRVAAIFLDRQQPAYMEKILRYANEYRPTPKLTNILAKLAYQRNEIDAALELWEKSLALEEEQVEAHKYYGIVIIKHKGERAQGVPHLERAVELDPTLADQLQQWLLEVGLEAVGE